MYNYFKLHAQTFEGVYKTCFIIKLSTKEQGYIIVNVYVDGHLRLPECILITYSDCRKVQGLVVIDLHVDVEG